MTLFIGTRAELLAAIRRESIADRYRYELFAESADVLSRSFGDVRRAAEETARALEQLPAAP